MVLISGVVLEGGLHVGSSGGRIESVANFVFIYLHVAHENRLLAKSFNENRFINQDALKHHDSQKKAGFNTIFGDLGTIFRPF